MKKKRLSELTEQDQQLVSAWIDGELDTRERSTLEARIDGGEQTLRRERIATERLGADLRTCFRTIEAESTTDIWSKIEGELQKEARRKKAGGWSSGIQKVFEEFKAAFAQPRMLGGLAAAAVLMMVFQFREPDPTRSHPLSGDFTKREALEIEALQSGGSGSSFASSSMSRAASAQPEIFAGMHSEDDLLTRVGIGREGMATPTHMSDALALRLMASPQLIVDNQQVSGGLRAGGTDIEWIKTGKPFRLVSPREPNTPPVIWVARASKRSR